METSCQVPEKALPALASLTAATIIISAAELMIDIVNAILRILFRFGIGS